MKFVKFAIATTALFGFASAAQAQDTGAYAAVSVDALNFDAYALSGRIGYNFSEYFGVEGQAGFGIIDDKETFQGIEAKAGIDNFFAGFITARVPAGEQFELIGRVGYYSAEQSGSAAGISIAADADGIAAGLGAIFWLNEKSGIRAEYTYLDGDGGNSDLFSLGYQFKF